MKTERVTAVGALRTAKATMAWFFRSRPTCRTVTGAATFRSAGGVKAASVATSTWASPARAASAEARASASPMSAVAAVAVIPARAARTRPMSAVALATTRGVAPAATTLTRPPDGRSRSASSAACFAASRRDGATSVAAMLAEASIDHDEVAGERCRPLHERLSREEREQDHQQQLEEQEERAAQPLPGRVRLEVLAEALPEERRADRALRAPELQHPEREHQRHEGEADQSERRGERHRRGPPYPTTRRRRSSAKTRSASGTSEVSGT